MLTLFKHQSPSTREIQYKYKTFVTKSIIKALKDEIHPDYWYIFPEELPAEDPAYNKIQKKPF